MRLRHHPLVPGERSVHSTEAATLGDFAESVEAPATNFVLFVAADTRDLPAAEMVAHAKALLRAGASYVCCWGPDCERLHNCFDEAEFALFGEGTDEGGIMTTWHPDESLEEALWYAVHAAWPSSEFEASTSAVLVATVNEPEWALQVQEYLEAGAPLPPEA